MTLGNRIYDFRKKAGLTRDDVAPEVLERPREAVGGQSDNTLADTQCFAR